MTSSVPSNQQWGGVEKLAQQRNDALAKVERLRAALNEFVDPNCHCGLCYPCNARKALSGDSSTPETTVLHEGVRQSYLKACELSLASGLLGDGDKSDLLELYESLWPRAPVDVRSNALRSSAQQTEARCPDCGLLLDPPGHEIDCPRRAPKALANLPPACRWRVKSGDYAGQIVYPGRDSYGCASEDTRNTGVEHIACSVNESGQPFFTIPRTDLELI